MGQPHSSTVTQRVEWVSELLASSGNYGVVSQQEEHDWGLTPDPLYLESQRASGSTRSTGSGQGSDGWR